MIQLLPPYIANQIAAGEVVGRGASIVKELVENSVDSGATLVRIRVEDGGRTMVQVVDNGCGISKEDAPKAFLRHATSKIRTAEDLFALRTFGFRGEALASIASVAEVELITKREEDELGVRLVMRDGEQVENEQCAATTGTSITVRNLFYSIPARRKFLKSESYESRLCYEEFLRVALVNHSVGFEYQDSRSTTPTILLPQNRITRIVALTKNSYSKKLLSIKAESPLMNLSGFIGTPDTAKARGRVEQYLFVNGRYFRNPRIFKTICNAYDRIIAPNTAPCYFLYLELPEGQLDVNINPTKTEVKFEDEDTLLQIIASTVRQTLGKNNIVEAIDFTTPALDIPSYSATREVPTLEPSRPRPNYSPFSSGALQPPPGDFDEQVAHFDEEFIFSTPIEQKPAEPTVVESRLMEVEISYRTFSFGSGKYFIVDTLEGLTTVNVNRALCRIEYEEVLSRLKDGAFTSQLLAFPEILELNSAQKSEVLNSREQYELLGFKIEDNGASQIRIESVPLGFEAKEFLELIASDNRLPSYEERIAELLTKDIKNKAPKVLSSQEAVSIYEKLLCCQEPLYTPYGLKVCEIITSDELDSRFKR
ncbi:MAG: DNA mismatch repair endonuclease MutL [Rikenellaceae bacterium]